MQAQQQRLPKVGEVVNLDLDGKNTTATVMVFIDRNRAMVQNIHGSHLIDFKQQKFQIVPQD